MSSKKKGSFALSWLRDLRRVAVSTRATTVGGGKIDLTEGLGKTLSAMVSACKSGRKIIFIGNGGSAAIASHMAIDYWKNGGLSAIAFNDSSLLTCVSNDYSFERVFAEPVRQFASAGDCLVAISSGGRSKNILNGVAVGRQKRCRVITLSGFDAANPLRGLGDVNFYVNSHNYGMVEIAHLSLLHSILDERLASINHPLAKKS